MSASLTILICTHDREDLLRRTIESLNAAERPAYCELLVIANNCADGTEAFLARYASEASANGWMPLRWEAEPVPGKSHALNRGVRLVRTELVAFVDDDHCVTTNYLISVVRAAAQFPDYGFFCGRILPDWDGSEPSWVHDTSAHRIFPLPVPRYEQGERSFEIGSDGPLPGGGNLFARTDVLLRVGKFSTALGPHGHDLGGGEDIDFIRRALQRGERLRYAPEVMQLHYVDLRRLTLPYVLRKAYQRSRSALRVHGRARGVPLYMWRKLFEYMAAALLSLRPARTRFFLVRIAATLGEIRGLRDRAVLELGRSGVAGHVALLFGLTSIALTAAFVMQAEKVETAVALAFAAAAVSALVVAAVMIKALLHFSQTGPELRAEVLRHFRGYGAMALLRLAFWLWLILFVLAGVGALAYAGSIMLSGREMSILAAAACAAVGLLAGVVLQFLRHLLLLPASIVASSNFRCSRLHPLWRRLTPIRIDMLRWSALAIAVFPVGLSAIAFLPTSPLPLLALGSAVVAALLTRRWLHPPEARPSRHVDCSTPDQKLNVLMIGSDTLRADRLGVAGYRRPLTPFIDSLAAKGTFFAKCYTPCARTAPSLISMLTGTWPHRHGIRDNFVALDDTKLAVAALPSILGDVGYRTATISDWSGADFDKFPLGFEHADLPSDQWNIRYLMRQGPKDLRLFLSLFTHNRFGKRFLPELYYLAGVPLTHLVGRDARELISELAEDRHPFLLNVFMATTHPPFGSEYPHYTTFADPGYDGESRFAMARLTDPWEILRRQGDSKKEFDLDQIINLYDGCVRNFDEEVKCIWNHVEKCGIAGNTLLVIYSDHGMEFFEHDTWGQGNSVRAESSPRVPLVIVDPRLPGGPACDRVVRTVDIAPTLLELLDVPRLSAMDGVSLVPLLRREAEAPELAAFNETGIWLTDLPGTPARHLRYPNLLELLDVPDKRAGTLAIRPEYRRIVVEAKDRMIRFGPWKLTYQPTLDGPILALFNLEDDPLCEFDVAPKHPDIVTDLLRRLEAWIAASDLRNAVETVLATGQGEVGLAA
jgi:arylsulfatase A-like enzyme/GT2 family glycosyltransferase